MNYTILYAEADCDYAELICGLLMEKGYKVVYASSGKEAHEQLKQSSPDLVLLGLIMPDVDGFTFAGIVLESNPIIPIIFLTSLSDPQNEIKGFQRGACDYICKEAHTEVVLARIEKELKRTRKGSITIQLTPDTSIETMNKTLLIGGKRYQLGIRDFDLLMFLYNNINTVLPRNLVEQSIWGKNVNARLYLYKATYKIRKILKHAPDLSINTFRNGSIVMSNTYSPIP